jgi:hypothetical protein
MSNREMVVEVVDKYGAMTSKQAANLVYREYGITLTPAQVAGSLRPLVAQGKAATSKDAYGKTVYWITDFGKNQ